MVEAAAERDAALAIARELLGAAVDAVEPVRRGRNSRVFRVTAGATHYALKRYPAPSEDARDRLGTETEALRLMSACGVADVPRVIAADPARRCALLTWLDGAPPAAVTDVDIDAAAAFLAAMHAMRAHPAGRAFGRPAAEACVSGREIEVQIDGRLDALRRRGGTEPELAAFLRASFAPALETLASRARSEMAAAGLDFAEPLPQEERSLVPADFGFHNCLRGADGTLRFLDFEYFGWDDPVKLTADMLHHPGTPLAPAQRAHLREAALRVYGQQPAFAARLHALYPLFGMRWVLILLNEFLPERWRQRVAAGETAPWTQAKARQLARARDLLARLVPTCEEAAHG
jgi:hypothetical protein